jgi:PIN domain nuclease of toxin-antitoxin system
LKFLLDTHVLLWAAAEPAKLRLVTRDLLNNAAHQPVFSVASLWEIGIKAALGQADFSVDPRVLRRGLVDNGYEELEIRAIHVLTVDLLPPFHRDPFDRILIAQARVEGMTLITADPVVSSYPVRTHQA